MRELSGAFLTQTCADLEGLSWRVEGGCLVAQHMY